MPSGMSTCPSEVPLWTKKRLGQVGPGSEEIPMVADDKIIGQEMQRRQEAVRDTSP